MQTVRLMNGLADSGLSMSLAYLKRGDALLAHLERDKLHRVISCEASAHFDMSVLLTLAQCIRTENIATVVTVNQHPLFYGYAAGKLSGTNPRLVNIFHTTQLLNTMESIKYAAIYKWLYARCDCVVFVSRKQRDFWLSERHMRPNYSVYIYNGVDTTYFQDVSSLSDRKRTREKLGFGDNDLVVGICAGLRPEKRHLDLLAALYRIKRSGEEGVKVLIIGSGVMEPVVRAYIDEHSLGGDVVLAGHQQDVRPLVTICDCIALTSDFETFPMAILEAMALGKPVVCTNVGGTTEQVLHGKNGYLFDVGAVEVLSGLIMALRDKDLRMRMGDASREMVKEKFESGRMLAEYRDLFLRLGSA